MRERNYERSLALAITMLAMTATTVLASDDAKLPDWSGQRVRT